MDKKMSRKQFIESQGATCRNWNWSWSFINMKEKVVIFGAWDIHSEKGRSLILDETWERGESGRKNAGYTQAIEHIRLVESGEFSLKIFRMYYSDERTDDKGRGPATIKSFVPALEIKVLTKKGGKWFAVD